ncbi:hypothetical protein [Ruminococcus sp.]|nr:hypothetical protein [Ruminococcus sp.]
MYKIETERGDLFDVNMMIAIKKNAGYTGDHRKVNILCQPHYTSI